MDEYLKLAKDKYGYNMEQVCYIDPNEQICLKPTKATLMQRQCNLF